MTEANQIASNFKKTRPWEDLHTVNVVDAPGRLTTAEALRYAKQDWTVHKVNMLTNKNVLKPTIDEIDEEASDNLGLYGIANPQMAMTVRVDYLHDEHGERTNVITNRSYLGTVGVRYGVVQNDEYAAFFDDALGEGAAIITSAGTLGRFGARVFMVATLPDMLELVPGDPVERHILITNTHDGSGPVEVMFVAFDPVLKTMVYTPGGRKRIRHTKHADKRLATAKKVLRDNEAYWQRAQRACEYLNSQRASERRARDFAEAMFPPSPVKDNNGKQALDPDTGEPLWRVTPQTQTLRDELLSLAASEELPKTDYGLWKAACLWVDHCRKRKKSSKDLNTHASQWEVSVFGPGADFRDRAFKWLQEPRK